MDKNYSPLSNSNLFIILCIIFFFFFLKKTINHHPPLGVAVKSHEKLIKMLSLRARRTLRRSMHKIEGAVVVIVDDSY